MIQMIACLCAVGFTADLAVVLGNGVRGEWLEVMGLTVLAMLSLRVAIAERKS